MSIILAIVLWVGAIAFFLLLAGGVRRGDSLRARALSAHLDQDVEDALEAEPAGGGGRLAAPPRISRPVAEARRPVAQERLSKTRSRRRG